MKVLLVAPIFPPAVGGVPTLYHHICRAFPAGEIVVVAATTPGDEAFDRQQPYPIHRVPPFAEIDLGNLRTIYGEARRIHRMARRESATHIVFGHVNQSLLAMMLRLMNPLPQVLYAHGEEIVQDYGGRLYRWCKQWFLRTVPQAVAVSHFTGKQLAAFGSPNLRVAVIPNAVETHTFAPQDRDPELVKKWGLSGRRIILTVARLEARKGHDRVIDALPRVLDFVPEAHYVICGTGEEGESLRERAQRQGVADRVTFIDHISNELLCSVYNLADVFVMPNRRMPDGVTEGFGIVFLEAGACGIPVIGGNDGGVPDAVRDGETGYLVAGDDVDAIAGRLIELLGDPATARRMGAAGRAFAQEHSYPKLVASLTAFLESPHAA